MMLEPLDDEELTAELGLVIDASLDTSAKLSRCARSATNEGARRLAFETAGRLAQAASELQRLLPTGHRSQHRSIAGSSPDRPEGSPDASEASPDRSAGIPARDRGPGDGRVLDECERAIAVVACRYRDAVDWSVPDSTHRVLMRHYGEVVAHYERLRGARRSAGACRTAGSARDRRPPGRQRSNRHAS